MDPVAGLSRNEIFRREFSSGPDVDRTAFFSDAVFAIAMTLLAVEIQVPQVHDRELGRAVAGQLPQFLAYVLSFVVTGAFWQSHHRMFRVLRGFTSGLQRLNLVLLLFVALIGYATDMLAFYGHTALGVAVYAGALGIIGAVDSLMWLYCSRQGLFREGYDARLLARAWLHAGIAPAVFLLSVPVAFLFGPDAAKLSWLAILAIEVPLNFRGRKPLPAV